MALIQDGPSAERDRTALIEESILLTRAGQLPIGTVGYAWIWVGIVVNQRASFGVHGTHLPYLAVRRRRDVVLIALPVTQRMIAGIGMVSLIATGNWNPVGVIQGDAQGIALLVLLILVVLAQWSTNNSANLIPAALTFINLAPRHQLSHGRGDCGRCPHPVLSVADPGQPVRLPGQLRPLPVGHRRHHGRGLLFHLKPPCERPALYDPEGQYRYHRGFNPAGLIAWLLAGAVAALVVGLCLCDRLSAGVSGVSRADDALVLPRHAQAELTSRGSDEYLAASVGMDWVHLGGGRLPASPADRAARPTAKTCRPSESRGRIVPGFRYHATLSSRRMTWSGPAGTMPVGFRALIE
jgi:hypothetical protein